MVRIAVIVAIVASCMGGSALAATASCEQQAAEKKLSLRAETKFIKQCQKDAIAAATIACDSQAEAKQLAGTAKQTFTKKCVKDATKDGGRGSGYAGIG